MSDDTAETLQQLGVTGGVAYWTRVRKYSGALAAAAGVGLVGWLVAPINVGGWLGNAVTAMLVVYVLMGVAGWFGAGNLAGDADFDLAEVDDE